MIRVGIVGTGGMGTVHYTNYQYIEECQVAAVCGNREKAEKWGVNDYSDITEMIQSCILYTSQNMYFRISHFTGFWK